MTNKLAIFVEGQTEALFVQELLSNIVTKSGLTIENYVLEGGSRLSRTDRSCSLIAVHSSTGVEKFFVRIYNSTNDSKVNVDIKDRYQLLVEDGFSCILGLYDLYGKNVEGVYNSYEDRSIEISSVNLMIKRSKLSNVKITVAIMELETWFLCEENHFSTINRNLTDDLMKSICNVMSDTIEEDIERPTEVLKTIYEAVGYNYSKKRHRVLREVKSLDYENLYFNCRKRSPSLDHFLTGLDTFIDSILT